MRSAAELLSLLLLTGCIVVPQDPPPDKSQEQTPPEPKWELSVYAMAVSVSGESDFVSPVVTADRGPVHLEARYNYEAEDTASVWFGWNFAWEGDVELSVTPMAGIVFGDVDGFAPGVRASLTWKQFDATTEAEYLINADDHDDSFFYSWTELGWSLLEVLRVGVVGQRSRVLSSERELDRGLLLQVSPGKLYFTLYAFEPWDDDRYWAFTAGTSF